MARNAEKILDLILKEIDNLKLYNTNPKAHKRIMAILSGEEASNT